MNRSNYNGRSVDQMKLSQLKLWLEYQFLEVHKKLDALTNEVKKKRVKKLFMLVNMYSNTTLLKDYYKCTYM